MADKDFVKKEYVLDRLKLNLKELSSNSNKDKGERGFFGECLVQIEAIETKAAAYDEISGSYYEVLEKSRLYDELMAQQLTAPGKCHVLDFDEAGYKKH